MKETDWENEDNSGEELYEHFKFVADKGQEPLRVDKFLLNFVEKTTRNKIQQAARAGNIHVNGVAVKQNYKVKPFDEVALVLAHPPIEFEIIPQDIPISIIYEDDDVLVINKDPMMVVHPGHGNYSGTLVNALSYYFQSKNIPTDLDRVGLVHRIDKGTSGLLVIAKTEYALHHLANQFYKKTTQRTYQALVWGRFDEEKGTINGNLDRNPKNRLQMMVYPEGDQGKEAITHYQVLEDLRYVSLIECQLETGRTHQIRAHMKYLGHPLFNDERYEGNAILKGTTFTKYKQFVTNCFKILPRQALHAKSLGFIHPTTKENMYFEAPLPEDFQECLDKWRNYLQYV